MIRFDVRFSSNNRRIDVEMRLDESAHFETSFGAVHEVTLYKDADLYTGAYQVTPKVGAQVLPTAQKLMTDDVIIKPIPIYDVSNASGGRTVYIAREV